LHSLHGGLGKNTILAATIAEHSPPKEQNRCSGFLSEKKEAEKHPPPCFLALFVVQL